MGLVLGRQSGNPLTPVYSTYQTWWVEWFFSCETDVLMACDLSWRLLVMSPLFNLFFTTLALALEKKKKKNSNIITLSTIVHLVTTGEKPYV